tara:strand:- start:1137 stop:1319 length:183 start_codon:yes stop_codon:yes gene_type:complete
MKTWLVQIVKAYHRTAEINIEAETEQEAIRLSEDLVFDDDDEHFSDFVLIEQFVEEVKES